MPQPIDMQTEVARTLLAERILQAHGRANLTAQQRQAMEQRQIRMKVETQVNEAEELKDRDVDPDGKGANTSSGQSKSHRDDEKRPGETAHKRPAGDEGLHLDVSI